jgi:hypothetical protein
VIVRKEGKTIVGVKRDFKKKRKQDRKIDRLKPQKSGSKRKLPCGFNKVTFAEAAPPYCPSAPLSCPKQLGGNSGVEGFCSPQH